MNFLLVLFGVLLLVFPAQAGDDVRLLNASYDPTRNFYDEYNQWFKAEWERDHAGQKLVIRQSHAGSGKQARAVIDGLPADVVTLALAYDLDMIAEKSGAIALNWRDLLPNQAVPMTSTIVFLVRKGNPLGIHDWVDVVRDGVQVVMPNPKTSGGARWNYLAAWAFAMRHVNGDEPKAIAFMKQLYANVRVLDTGARASTTTFAQRNIGDVLITWEAEAYMVMENLGADRFEIIYPSMSIAAETPVAVVQSVVQKKNKTDLAQAYLKELFSPEAQNMVAEHFFRPVDANIMQRYREQFPRIPMVQVNDFGGWDAVQKKHFDAGGIFDQIYAPPQK